MKKRLRYYIGIDPGMTGAIAFVGKFKPFAYKIPETDEGLLGMLRTAAKDAECFAFLELVHSMPAQGVASSFKFGMGFGKLQMALTAADIKYELVTPHKWQSDLLCATGGDKNITKERAQALFPALKVTHTTADALLIAEWGRRKTERAALPPVRPPRMRDV